MSNLGPGVEDEDFSGLDSGGCADTRQGVSLILEQVGDGRDEAFHRSSPRCIEVALCPVSREQEGVRRPSVTQ